MLVPITMRLFCPARGRRRVSLWLLAALMPCVATAADERPHPRVKQVILVFKTHFDIGFTDLAKNVVERYRTQFADKALSAYDDTRRLAPERQFVWTVPGWPLTQMLAPDKQDSQRRQRVLEMVRDGHLVFQALPFSTHTESLELEDLVRGMRFSSELARSLGQPLPRDAKMTDVPSHTWALPTILKHAGIDFLHLGCNGASAVPGVPMLFWWEGPDGSRVLTMQSPAYGSDLLPPDDWPHDTWLALIHTGDNQGPPTPKQLRELFARAERELPGVAVRTGRLSDFAEAILKEHPSLPVVRKDLPDTWIHGIMSMPVETGIARRVRPRIAAAEALDTLLRAWNVTPAAPDARPAIADAYEQSLLYGEHTWGLSRRSYEPRLYGDEWLAKWKGGAYARAEESWAEHGNYIRRVPQIIEPELRQRLDALAAAVKVDGPRIVVFNPLPWKRDELVSVTPPHEVTAVLDAADTGRVEPVDSDAGNVTFLARDLPPLGYRTYVPATPAGAVNDAPAAAPGGDRMENAFFILKLDTRRGGISSLVDKSTGRELLDASAPYALGQYLYQRFDSGQVEAFQKSYNRVRNPGAFGKPDLPGGSATAKTPAPPRPSPDFGKQGLPPAERAAHADASPPGFKLSPARIGRVTARVELSSEASPRVPHATSLTITLYRDLPYVDLEWRVKGKQPDPWPEAGWLCLPFAIDHPRFHLGRVGSVTDPVTDIAPNTNHHVACLNTGLMITDGGGVGVGLCSPDTPLVSLDRPGLWLFSREFTPERPHVYLNLFNNQWSTNFQQWIGGSWSARVRLWAAAKSEPAKGLIEPSWNVRSPCLGAFADGPAGHLPPSQSGIDLSRPGVLVTAFGANPDGQGTLLRLWEQAGSNTPCRVTLPTRTRHLQPVDLRGRATGGWIDTTNGYFDIPLTSFAPASLLLVAEQ